MRQITPGSISTANNFTRKSQHYQIFFFYCKSTIQSTRILLPCLRCKNGRGCHDLKCQRFQLKLVSRETSSGCSDKIYDLSAGSLLNPFFKIAFRLFHLFLPLHRLLALNISFSCSPPSSLGQFLPIILTLSSGIATYLKAFLHNHHLQPWLGMTPLSSHSNF